MKKRTSSGGASSASLEKKRKYVELAATVGLLLVLVAMMLPFFGSVFGSPIEWGKWVYAAARSHILSLVS